MRLPGSFLEADASGFAGGVEMAMMSTTHDPEVALEFSGGAGAPGSILRDCVPTQVSRACRRRARSMPGPLQHFLHFEGRS